MSTSNVLSRSGQLIYPRPNKLLIFLGIFLIGIAALNWLWTEPTVTTTSSLATQTTEESTASRTSERIKSSGKISIEQPGKKLISTLPGAETVTVDPGPPSRRSEAVTLGLLGFGALLVLVGAFFGRIQEVGFPGGSVKLAETTAKAAVGLNEQVQALREAVKELQVGGKGLAKEVASTKAAVADVVRYLKDHQEGSGASKQGESNE